jgi:hypothetical protein
VNQLLQDKVALRVPGQLRSPQELSKVLDIAVQVSGNQHFGDILKRYEMTPAAWSVVERLDRLAERGQ